MGFNRSRRAFGLIELTATSKIIDSDEVIANLPRAMRETMNVLDLLYVSLELYHLVTALGYSTAL
jgi:hypothetical protein